MMDRMDVGAPREMLRLLNEVDQHLDVGASRAEACAAAGISELSLLRWTAQFRRPLTADEATELGALEADDLNTKHSYDGRSASI